MCHACMCHSSIASLNSCQRVIWNLHCLSFAIRFASQYSIPQLWTEEVSDLFFCSSSERFGAGPLGRDPIIQGPMCRVRACHSFYCGAPLVRKGYSQLVPSKPARNAAGPWALRVVLWRRNNVAEGASSPKVGPVHPLSPLLTSGTGFAPTYRA